MTFLNKVVQAFSLAAKINSTHLLNCFTFIFFFAVSGNNKSILHRLTINGLFFGGLATIHCASFLRRTLVLQQKMQLQVSSKVYSIVFYNRFKYQINYNLHISFFPFQTSGHVMSLHRCAHSQ